jgi:hypothetical protein
MFLGLLDQDPDSLVRGMDPDLDHQAKIVRKPLIPTVFSLFWLFIFEKKMFKLDFC